MFVWFSSFESLMGSVSVLFSQASQNQFVVSCRDYIAFGASEDGGNNAIRLDNDLRVGLFLFFMLQCCRSM